MPNTVADIDPDGFVTLRALVRFKSCVKVAFSPPATLKQRFLTTCRQKPASVSPSTLRITLRRFWGESLGRLWCNGQGTRGSQVPRHTTPPPLHRSDRSPGRATAIDRCRGLHSLPALRKFGKVATKRARDSRVPSPTTHQRQAGPVPRGDLQRRGHRYRH